MGRVSGRGCVDGAGDGVVPVISANIHSETEEQRCRIDCQEGGGGTQRVNYRTDRGNTRIGCTHRGSRNVDQMKVSQHRPARVTSVGRDNNWKS